MRVAEAISFDFSLRHPIEKDYPDIYRIRGKGKKDRYVQIDKKVIAFLQSKKCQ
jgi:site-specific recombinase XerD